MCAEKNERRGPRRGDGQRAQHVFCFLARVRKSECAAHIKKGGGISQQGDITGAGEGAKGGGQSAATDEMGDGEGGGGRGASNTVCLVWAATSKVSGRAAARLSFQCV